ncbi:MAG: RsmG family class I SAM-dependent methyltransferase [Microthrixaceae bacterium]
MGVGTDVGWSPDGWLDQALHRAQALGILGPSPVGEHIRHAERFVAEVQDGEIVLDLGSGGGLPGLVIAARRPTCRITLLDANERRVALLRHSVSGAPFAVEVVCGRAESLARTKRYRRAFDTVVARGFGPPAVSAECAVGFLRVGGRFVVSEPPDNPDDVNERWPELGLSRLGLRRTAGPIDGGVRVFRLSEAREDFPRSDGVPRRRPLF